MLPTVEYLAKPIFQMRCQKGGTGKGGNILRRLKDAVDFVCLLRIAQAIRRGQISMDETHCYHTLFLNAAVMHAKHPLFFDGIPR